MELDRSKSALDKTRVLPHNIAAEQSLLGAILIDNNFFETVSEVLQPKHFAAPINEKIYDAARKLISKGSVADPVTLRVYFEKNDDLKNIDGGAYLVQLVNSVVSLTSIEDYARLIYDLYVRRQLIELGDNIVHKACLFDIDEKAADQIALAEAKLYDIASKDKSGGVVSFSGALSSTMVVLEEAYKSESTINGITTGFIDMDEKLGGMNRSDLIILAGRPSMGKTALATNFAFNAAVAFAKKTDGGGKVMFFSLEMSKEQLVTRILSQECSVPSEKVRRGEVKEEDMLKIRRATKKMEEIPLFIDDTPALSVSEVRIRARRLKRQHGLDFIVIDYLQLLQGTSERKNENRVQEISDITRSLKALAKELDVPVLALSQLSRAVESRDDKRPQLSDLRESGSIEQDADIVMFVFREEYYVARTKPADERSGDHAKWMERMTKIHNLAEVILAKQRHGPIGTVKLYFDGKYTKFDNLSDSRKGSSE